MARMARDAGTWPDEQQEPAGAGRSRAVPWVATATGVVLLILAPRYGPHRDARGRLVWHEPALGNPEVIHQREPGTNFAQRGLLWLIGRLPIEWML